MVAVAVTAHALVEGLPWLIRRLGVRGDDVEEREEVRARLEATKAALARLDELAMEDWTRDDTIERLRGAYEFRRRRLKARVGKEDPRLEI
jgi:hypothetical protein